MAATAAVKTSQQPDSVPGGTPGTNQPMKLDSVQDNAKNMALTEKGNSSENKNVKDKVGEETVQKKFIDAPLPTTNPWTKRTAVSLAGDKVSAPSSNTEGLQGMSF